MLCDEDQRERKENKISDEDLIKVIKMGLQEDENEDEHGDPSTGRFQGYNGNIGGRLISHQNFLNSMLRDQDMLFDDHHLDLHRMRMHVIQRMEEEGLGRNPFEVLDEDLDPGRMFLPRAFGEDRQRANLAN